MRKKPLAVQDSEQLRELGRRIREIRRGMLSLEGLAKRADVSVGQLSQVENGTGNPSVEVLLRIADALSLELTDLVEQPAAERTHVVRAAERRPYRQPATGHEIAVIAPVLRHELGVVSGVLGPGEVRDAQSQVHGDVLYYVLAGELEVEKAGVTYPVGPGDSLLISFPHRLAAVSEVPVEHLAVIRPEAE
ncbi:helix-turn-helix domain-containing protein [Nocardia sp. BMG51109]|uniref:helix-turn-helix domain-containing protein n=1 Tax=Nocardia sp. BMG51109 TaxID=1056816 RepID=UPI0012EBD78A|nr:helix-turn-helix domain-containing protein [Nocardia sp. BMG51109]